MTHVVEIIPFRPEVVASCGLGGRRARCLRDIGHEEVRYVEGEQIWNLRSGGNSDDVRLRCDDATFTNVGAV